jgi:molybdopterin-guanine dinucleotide biosynthesis protein A
MRSAIILAGGKSSRIGLDKGLQLLNGKPLIKQVLGRITECVDEIIIVVGSNKQKQSYIELNIDVKIVVDEINPGTPLVGAYTGFNIARSKYCILVGNDMPFLDARIINQLFDLADGHEAATPSWPNGWIEPLLSVYKTKSALKITNKLVNNGEKKLGLIIRSLDDVVKLSIEDIIKVDPTLLTLFDIDTVADHQKAEEIMVASLAIKYNKIF